MGASMLTDFAFHKRRFEDLGMLDGSVSEVAALAEEFAVIGGDGDVGIGRNLVEELFHGAIEEAHGIHLPLAQFGELARVHGRAPRLAAGSVRIEMLEDAV